MIHHVALYQLKPDTDAEVVESVIRATRSNLLKVAEVLNVRSGRNVDAESKWQIFLAIEVESLEKLRIVRDNPHYLKFMEKYIRPNTRAHSEMDFELDPSKDLKYS